jgi:hypothetical protein
VSKTNVVSRALMRSEKTATRERSAKMPAGKV